MRRVTLFPLVTGVPLTDSMTAVKRWRMSVESTDRARRSMIALLVVEDKSPFAETRRRGAPATGASPIVSETFGKVAHPTPTVRVDTIRAIQPRRLRVVMCSFPRDHFR